MKRGILIGIVSGILILSIASTIVITGNLPGSGVGAQTQTITKVQSGLVASDPLNKFETQQQLQSNNSFWQYGGTGSSSNYYTFFEAADQLHIGVAAQGSGGWTGYYAVTPPTNASLVHAILSASNATNVGGYYDTGLYMSSSNQIMNYIACLAVSTPTGTLWGVVHAQSPTGENPVITPLWVNASRNQLATRDCAMTTNGRNSLSVYLDHSLVFQSNGLNLNMPAPYSFYVEAETQVASSLLYGNYRDFYATLGDTITVSGLPSTAESVDLVGTSGTVYASAPVVSGAAELNLGGYTFPLQAYVDAYSTTAGHSNSSLVASTPEPQTIYGGDVYTFGSPGRTTIALSLQAEDMGGHDMSGLAVVLSQNRQTIDSEYFPYQFTLNNSQTYTVTAYDYGSYTFDHWSDGSTSRVLTFSITKDTSLTAYYRDVNASPPAGKSIILVTAVDSSGKPLTGMTATLWQNGLLVGVTYTPSSFEAKVGSFYYVAASDFGGYTFSHWNNGYNGTFIPISVGAGTYSLEAVYTSGG